jgi:hypothetical protein
MDTTLDSKLRGLAKMLEGFALYKPYQPLLWSDLEAVNAVRAALLELANRATTNDPEGKIA